MKVIFLGTPDFAVATLQRLLAENYNIVGVVTAPDKPAGRGQEVHYSAVKVFAQNNNLNLLQPLNLKDETFCSQLKSLNADIQIVVAFRMLPEKVWNMPPLGTMNLHGSLLPQYRGAAPINWAIINGETITGVTTFLLKHEIDTGNILLQKKVEITMEDDFGTMYEKLKLTGSNLVIESLKLIESNNYETVPQQQFIISDLKHAPKINKELGKINCNNRVENVHNLVRGLSPIPAAYFDFEHSTGKILQIKIYKTSVEILEQNKEKVGAIITDGKTFLKLVCSNGLLNIIELQLQGKKRMKIDEFLRGFKF
jgi:methionyl-tRNA formyltransferase